MIKERFVAKDMRTALNLIKSALGDDAVVHRSRKIDGGIEIEASRTTPPDDDPLMRASRFNKSLNITSVDPSPIHLSHVCTEPAGLSWGTQVTVPQLKLSLNSQTETKPEKNTETFSAINTMQHEMALLRGLLENQFASRDVQNNPYHNHNQRLTFMRLLQLGLHAPLARNIIAQCDIKQNFSIFWEEAIYRLMRQIPVNDSDPIADGGIFAFVGPTGVGKTTTIAKLASRYVMEYGNSKLGLITTDCYRVAGREQLGIYGQILNVPVMTVRDEKELARALDKYANKDLVLIDTAGISQRDVQLAKRMTLFDNHQHEIQNYLVLSATSQKAVVDESLTRFGQFKLSGALLTKLDESTELGNIISLFIEREIHLDYLSTGQRVPQDIMLADGRVIVDKMFAIEHPEHQWLDHLSAGSEQKEGAVDVC